MSVVQDEKIGQNRTHVPEQRPKCCKLQFTQRAENFVAGGEMGHTDLPVLA